MNAHMDDLLAGRAWIEGARVMKDLGIKPSQPEDWLRVHMLHRLSPIHERFLLHPRVLDVLEAIIGPDVLALQSMLFFKQPGQPGQGYHQDSYYIPTFPDTLCGAWLALDPCHDRERLPVVHGGHPARTDLSQLERFRRHSVEQPGRSGH